MMTMTSDSKPMRSHAAFVLDRSGSMEKVRDVTVRGFNEQVQTVLGSVNRDNTTTSLFTFNHNVKEIFAEQPAGNLREISREDYVPNGNTALWDAVLYALQRLKNSTEDGPNDSYLVVIMTDGEENSSRWADIHRLRSFIHELQNTGRWVISFVGANIDLNKVAKESGISPGNIFSYTADAVGVAKSYGSTARCLEARLVANNAGVSPTGFDYATDAK